MELVFISFHDAKFSPLKFTSIWFTCQFPPTKEHKCLLRDLQAPTLITLSLSLPHTWAHGRPTAQFNGERRIAATSGFGLIIPSHKWFSPSGAFWHNVFMLSTRSHWLVFWFQAVLFCPHFRKTHTSLYFVLCSTVRSRRVYNDVHLQHNGA